MKVLVLGLGVSGLSVCKLLLSQGYNVFAYDDNKTKDDCPEGVTFVSDINSLTNITYAVISPGIPLFSSVVQSLMLKGVKICGELELAFRVSKSPFISITGTNGKTTTTSWVADMFRRARIKHRVVGNIGLPATEVASETQRDEVLVNEVSSYQLETVTKYTSVISCILNITEDHLQRHKTMEEYTRVKAKVLSGMVVLGESVAHLYNDAFVFSTDKEPNKGAWLSGERIYLGRKGDWRELINTKDMYLKGTHNYENGMAAAIIASLYGVDDHVIAQSLLRFKGVEHRIELVLENHKFDVYNDSKATNPDSTIKAIETFKGNKIHLLIGGSEKNSDFSQIYDYISELDIDAYLYGATSERMSKELNTRGLNYELCGTLEEAVKMSLSRIEENEILLFSPACASFDSFKNFEHRGRYFKELVLSALVPETNIDT